ncbi:unnamed protein product [Ceutorhynchus assimilis]|uniref:Gustatory receptor n=1 Tax=Ceutorhynchus assimilis TaxID=467358 RepID=A0A9N9QQ76_9CUCU|nr:unnamed protein product [Ceutorhynchus assimilis]
MFYKHSFTFLCPLIVLCSIFGICPSVFTRSASVRKNNFLWYQIYCTILMTLSLGTTAYVLYKKDESTVPYAVHVADTFVHFALSVTTLCMFVSSVYSSKGFLLNRMFKKMDYVDDQLKYSIIYQKRRLFTGIFIYCFLIIIYLIYDTFTWGSFLDGSQEYFFYNLPKNFQISQFSIGMLLPMSVLILNYLKIKGFNRALKNYSKLNYIQAAQSEANENNKNFFKQMCHVHTTIYEIVENFNKIFGTALLVGTLMGIGLVLHYIIILLVYFQFNGNWKGATKYKYYVLAQCINGMLIPLLQMLLLATIGDRVAFEASKSSNLCLALLNKFPAYSTYDWEREIIEELKTLMLQCSFRNIVITAKRFYSVNHTMLGFVITSLVTNIIVIMQFLGTNK